MNVAGKRAGDRGPEILHAGTRGVVAAMSMSGMRTLTTRLGLLGATPPEMITDQYGPDVIRRLSDEQRQALVVLLHWAYGAGGGAAFGALPGKLRLKPWAGPVFGAALWLFFQSVVAPTLKLRVRHSMTVRERAVLAADHLLYGAVLSELRRRPRH